MARRNFDNSNPDTDETLNLEYADAVARIKASRNRTLFLRVQTYAPLKEDGSKVFSLTGHVRVNCAEALRTLELMYGERFVREALVPISIYKNSMFIG